MSNFLKHAFFAVAVATTQVQAGAEGKVAPATGYIRDDTPVISMSPPPLGKIDPICIKDTAEVTYCTMSQIRVMKQETKARAAFQEIVLETTICRAEETKAKCQTQTTPLDPNLFAPQSLK